MPRLQLGGDHLSITADVPEQVARWLRSTKRRIGSVRPDPPSNLTFADRVPRLNVTARDPRAAISFLPATRPASAPQNSSINGQNGVSGLANEVASIWWYHTIELPGGVVTPGFYDHRPLVCRYGLPDSLEGQRALDVATFDGFWAFEMERRGAQVVATDIGATSELDLPDQARALIAPLGLDRESGDGFRLAHRALDSKVERVLCDVYKLDPDTLGTFDFLHVADLLLHLENPIGALRAMRRMCSGSALIVDCFDPALKGNGLTRYLGGWSGAVWWMPSLETLAQMVIDAGFASVEAHVVYALGNAGQPRGLWRVALRAQA
jgi:tRNA (mo5U34)-methyltransferase